MNKPKKNNLGTRAGGSKTNLYGLNFEKKIYLKNLLEQVGFLLKIIEGDPLKPSLYKIYQNQKEVGFYGRQGKIYSALKMWDPKKFSNEYLKQVFSKKIYPDAFILSFKPLKLIIFEKKWQQGSGSVDEKIQTAPFKLQMFEKLLRGTQMTCMYQYILSEWFKRPEYRNVKEYYENNKKIKIFTESENLSDFNVADYFS